jgi:hypothetical protein
MGFVVHSKWAVLGVPGVDQYQGERTMLGMDDVDEELQRGFGLPINELEPLLRVGGDAGEMKFHGMLQVLVRQSRLSKQFLTNCQRSHAAFSSKGC